MIYLSPPLCNRFTTITASSMFWKKILLCHTMTSLILAVIGLSLDPRKPTTQGMKSCLQILLWLDYESLEGWDHLLPIFICPGSDT